MKFIIYNNTGEILRYGEVSEGNEELQILDINTENLLLPESFPADIHNYYIANNVLTQKLPNNNKNLSFDYTTNTWVDLRDITSIKNIKLSDINLWRTTANQGYFTFSNKQIACDQLSKDDINGVNGEVSLTGALPDNFPMAWKCIDNTYVPIPDVATWTLFYKAMVQQGTTNFLHAQELKAAVASATSLEELDAISW